MEDSLDQDHFAHSVLAGDTFETEVAHCNFRSIVVWDSRARHVERDKKTNSDRNGRTMSFQSKVIPLVFPSKNGGKETKKNRDHMFVIALCFARDFSGDFNALLGKREK